MEWLQYHSTALLGGLALFLVVPTIAIVFILLRDRKRWNNGKCSNCQAALEFVQADPKGMLVAYQCTNPQCGELNMFAVGNPFISVR